MFIVFFPNICIFGAFVPSIGGGRSSINLVLPSATKRVVLEKEAGVVTLDNKNALVGVVGDFSDTIARSGAMKMNQSKQ